MPLVIPIGSILSGFLMGRYGRIRTLKLSVLPSICGWCLIAVANNVTTLIIGRIILGICLSINFSCIYIEKVSNTINYRYIFLY